MTTLAPTTIAMYYKKETEKTWVYQEISNGVAPARIGRVYIQKWTLGANPPEFLDITLTPKSA
jgi:hypothetical protein